LFDYFCSCELVRLIVSRRCFQDARIIEEEDDTSAKKPALTKADVLVQEEEKPVGKVTWKAYREFMDGLGYVFLSSSSSILPRADPRLARDTDGGP
jgi:hypothetical protein